MKQVKKQRKHKKHRNNKKEKRNKDMKQNNGGKDKKIILFKRISRIQNSEVIYDL